MKRFVFFMITWALVAAVPRDNRAQAENQDKDPDVPKELFDNSREYPENNFHTFEDAPEEVFDNSREYSKYNFQAFEEG